MLELPASGELPRPKMPEGPSSSHPSEVLPQWTSRPGVQTVALDPTEVVPLEALWTEEQTAALEVSQPGDSRPGGNHRNAIGRRD